MDRRKKKQTQGKKETIFEGEREERKKIMRVFSRGP